MLSNPVTELRPPLLKTKISIPRLPGEFVHRPRLTERIDQGVKGPLTLLAAPAGFGKTNLLIEWIKETTLPVAWLTVDSDDNDLSRFIRYVIGALQTLKAGVGGRSIGSARIPTGRWMENWINAVDQRAFCSSDGGGHGAR